MSLGGCSTDIYFQKLPVERPCLSSKEHLQNGPCLGARSFLSHSVSQKNCYEHTGCLFSKATAIKSYVGECSLFLNTRNSNISKADYSRLMSCTVVNMECIFCPASFCVHVEYKYNRFQSFSQRWLLLLKNTRRHSMFWLRLRLFWHYHNPVSPKSARLWCMFLWSICSKKLLLKPCLCFSSL